MDLFFTQHESHNFKLLLTAGTLRVHAENAEMILSQYMRKHRDSEKKESIGTTGKARQAAQNGDQFCTRDQVHRNEDAE